MEPLSDAAGGPVPVGRRAGRLAALDAVEDTAASMCRSEQRVCRALARGIDPAMEPAAYSVLCAVRLAGSCRVTDLAVILGMRTSAVSGHVASLQRLGLVERGAALDDERSRPVRLTPEGLRRLDEARACRRRGFRQQLEGWSRADVVDLAELLTRFNAAYPGGSDGPPG
ncbi:MarR family winged helix-turn-helix transcriptional regulator [Arthrobacter pityocampae]|uniref:MarR family winged helix-turn-helix transcriptional regulator n=1 Tax=Arthrobacter pityocampae TaxID=547334 RepID=UPI00373563A9